MNRLIAYLFVGGMWLQTATTGLSQSAMDETYGIGVHAYFSGNLNQADELFTQLIDAGSQDPRVHYYRGITRTKLAGEGAGLLDFERGADLEMQGTRAVEVGRALQRIQGRVRLEIEKARSASRLVWAKKRAAERARLEAIAPSPAPAGAKDPFSDDVSPLQGRAEKMAAPAVQPEVEDIEASEANDPFSDSDSDDPFSDSAPSKKPANDDDDPFGG